MPHTRINLLHKLTQRTRGMLIHHFCNPTFGLP